MTQAASTITTTTYYKCNRKICVSQFEIWTISIKQTDKSSFLRLHFEFVYIVYLYLIVICNRNTMHRYNHDELSSYYY